AAAGVNVMDKDTEAFIGVSAKVTGDGQGSGLTVNTGGFGLEQFDTSAGKFQPGSGADFDASTNVDTVNDTIDLRDSMGQDKSGLNTGDQVVYRNNGGTNIDNLHDGQTYFVRSLGGGLYKLYNSASDANANTNAVDLLPGGTGKQSLRGIQSI